MIMRNALLCSGLLVLLASGIQGWSHQTISSAHIDTTNTLPATAYIRPTAANDNGAAVNTNAANTASPLQSTSLAGVTIPQSLTTDDNGNLIADEGLRELMDFFLTLTGEMSTDAIRTHFSLAAGQQCASDCAATATVLFDRYQSYLAQMQAQQDNWLATDDLSDRLDAVVRLRHQLLGDELADAWFGYEEQYDALRIQAWKIQQDNTLSPLEKTQQLQALRYTGPDGLSEREQAQQQWRELQELQQHLDQYDSASLYGARLQQVGADATARLQQLDTRRAEWQARYQHYRAEVTALRQSNLAVADQAQLLENLRREYFDAQEILRVAALDRHTATE